MQCFRDISANFIYGFLCWVCDQRRGKGGRRRPGIRHTSSLETFWKWYLIVYRLEIGEKIAPMVQRQGQDVRCSCIVTNLFRIETNAHAIQVVKIVAEKKGLDHTKRASATMYVDDLAEYSRVMLSTTEMTYQLGLLRILTILFGQLAGITGNRPEALVELRYRHLMLTLVRDHNSSRPRLFIELTAEFTKGFLGMKDSYDGCSPLYYFGLSLCEE